MTEADKVFSGAIPELYDRLLVPMIFEPYARDLAERVARLKPNDLLEIAAGTGAVTRAVAARLDPAVHFVATDLTQPMLDIAMSKQPAGMTIQWRQADALDLPFEAETFDVVACQFGAMFFPDKVQGYREARRVLRPGGHYLFNVWDSIETNDFVRALSAALEGWFPDDPPRFMARGPHGYHDVEAIRAQVEAAGFRSIEIETVDATSRAASALVAATAYCQGTPLRDEILARDPSGLEAITEKAAEVLRQKFGDGAVEGRIRAHVVTAMR